MAERESPYLWSTTAASNNSIDPSINFAEGQLPGTLNNSNRSTMAAVARFLKDINGSITSGGSANAYTLTINGTQTAYATGQIYSFKANFANTAAATLNVTNADATAIGAKSIRVVIAAGEAALLANMIVSGGHYLFQYDAAANAAAGGFILLNPSSVSGPGAATDNAVTRFDGTTGALIQNSGVIIDDTQNVTGILALTATGAISGASATGTMVATQSDQETSTSTTTLVSPGRQQYHPSAAKGWINFNAAATVEASYNVTSLTDGGTGNFTVNWNVDMSSAHYCAQFTIELSAVATVHPLIGTIAGGGATQLISIDNAASFTETNVAGYHCSVHGDQ